MPNVYQKQFDSWNEKKKKIEAGVHPENFYLHEREVWWCTVGVNVGVEIDGKNSNFASFHDVCLALQNLFKINRPTPEGEGLGGRSQ